MRLLGFERETDERISRTWGVLVREGVDKDVVLLYWVVAFGVLV